jgi:HD-GYP domain-containing protein (c-di-GMP phosphodiesterase class II)
MSLSPSTFLLNKQEFWDKYLEKIELIEELLDIGAALSGTQDLGELLNLILTKSREITCSDAGSLYLVDYTDNTPKLLFKVAQNDSRSALSFNEFAMPMTPQSLAGYVALTGASLNLPDAYEIPPDVPYKLARNFDEDFAYRTRSILVLPMQNRQGEITGVLQLINRKIKANEILTIENTSELTQPYSQWEERLVRSLASQAAISIERNNLQESIENLFEGFVKASVQVIEARDPCTSGHSERVAELTVRLSQEVNTVTEGPLGLIQLSPRQIQEIRYAALLHDVGKIGVPEAILTKQKKLYPGQLDVMRHRFALAQRTLEMDCINEKYQHLLEHSRNLPSENPAICGYCQNLTQVEKELDIAKAKLNHYWNILLEANEPHILTAEPLAQLRELSHLTYRDIDGEIKPLITPEELIQLMIPRGTLTGDERLHIEAHVIHTYEFLKRIPWTKDLKDVPAIAHGHHEKLDGSGYPCGLKSPDISIQSQIMAITDIYDALTAGDRPYKKGLATKVALKILRQEVSQKKINGELLQLFEQRQVFAVLGHQLMNE